MHMRGVPIVHARAALQHRAWPALIRLHAAEMDNWHCDSNTTYTMRNVARPSDLPARCGGPQDWLREETLTSSGHHRQRRYSARGQSSPTRMVNKQGHVRPHAW